VGLIAALYYELYIDYFDTFHFFGTLMTLPGCGFGLHRPPAGREGGRGTVEQYFSDLLVSRLGNTLTKSFDLLED